MPIQVQRDESESEGGVWKALKVTGGVLLGLAAVAGLGAWLAREQMDRHKRDLFSPHPLRRLAALGYLSSHPDIDNVLLLRDYVAWEEQPLLRKRASSILESMEQELVEAAESGESA